eukprot:g39600.t1
MVTVSVAGPSADSGPLRQRQMWDQYKTPCSSGCIGEVALKRTHKALGWCVSQQHQWPNQSPSTNTLIRLTKLALTLNNFSFNSSHFLQTKVVAMGTCMGLCYACLLELEQFITFTNTFHPNLKFTWTISDSSFPFLDLSVSMSGNHLNTDICFKPTDSHSYLDYSSSHPPSRKNAIPYSQFLHLCPQDAVFHSRTSQMSSYFKD